MTNHDLPGVNWPQRLDRRAFLGRVGASIVAVMPASALVACGSDDDGAGSTGQGTVGDGAPGGVDEITFNTHQLSEGASSQVFEELMKRYEQQTGVTVAGNAFPFNEALNQYILQARSGNLVGVIELPQGWIPPLVELDALLDLASVFDSDLFIENVADTVTYKDGLYALPTTSGAIGMVGNGVLLRQAGVTELPTTIDQFEEALEAIKALGPDLIPYAAMTAIDQGRDIASWMRAFGSDVIRDDGTVTLGDDGSVAALDWFKDLLDRGLIAPNLNRFDARPLFAQGRVGFYDDADIAPSIIAAETDDQELLDNMVPVPRPKVPGVDLPPQALKWGGGGYAVLKGESDVEQSSVDFATWMATDLEAVLTLFEGTGRAPVLLEALDHERFRSDEWSATWTEEISVHARSLFDFYPEAARMETIMGEQLEAFLLGDKSAEEALQVAKDEISELAQA